MTEELTAEERAWCLAAAYNAPCVQRLLRLYDAALAQSKADREWCAEMTRLNDLRGQERDAALARAAELEADQKRHLESIAGEARCLGQLRTDLDTERSRIARAVAELEKAHVMSSWDAGQVVCATVAEEALSILKGQP
jgi:hypothetical protein